MYAVIAVGLMIVLPVGSVAVEMFLVPSIGLPSLLGKWFTFWGIGVRLLIAGVNQVSRPGFTAKDIFKINDPEAGAVVRELGNANLAFGLIGILSLPFPGFLMAAAIAGGLFLALDGLVHLLRKHRNRNETIAMVTDFIIPVTTIIYLVGALL